MRIIAALIHVFILRVVDGDTVQIMTLTGKVTLRLAAIDCPELTQTYGIEARDALEQKINQGVTTIELGNRDVYRRLLAQLYVNNEEVNSWLVAEGYCWKYKHTKNKKLESLQHEAQKRKIGLWRHEQPIPPWEWRRAKKQT